MAEFIQKTDTLNQGREKLNEAIKDADKAKADAGAAVNTSNQAKQIAQTAENKADSVQAQFDQVVIEGDSSVEAAQARVDAKGNPHTTLKARLDAEHTEVTAQLAEKAEQNKIALLEKIRIKVEPPEGFSWKIAPINIYRNGLGRIFTDFDASDFKYKGTGKTYYVSLENGSDSNDGLSKEYPFKSIHVARAKTDVNTIIVDSGYYEDLYGFNNKQTDNKNINIVAAEGADVTISTRRKLEWSKTADVNNVYQANRSLVASVYDSKILDKDGDFTKLKRVESVVKVDSERGTYYYNNNILYVHTVDGRPADDDIHVFLDIKNYFNEGNYRTYFEGLKVYGGSAGCVQYVTGDDQGNPLFVAKNCEFKYSSGGNGGLEILGADAYFQNSIGIGNYADGFNYHSHKNRKPKAIEVDCPGKRNGLGRGTNQDNGSTMHDGGWIIRVNGEYSENEGPNVHDIGEGTESWNVGTASHSSAATAQHRESNYRVEQGAKMWIDSVVGYDSLESIYVGVDSVLYKHNELLQGQQTINGEVVDY